MRAELICGVKSEESGRKGSLAWKQQEGVPAVLVSFISWQGKWLPWCDAFVVIHLLYPMTYAFYIKWAQLSFKKVRGPPRITRHFFLTYNMKKMGLDPKQNWKTDSRGNR